MGEFAVDETLYSKTMEEIQPTDKVEAAFMNAIIGTLLNNDAYILKQALSKIDMKSIIQDTETNDENKVPSSAVTYLLKQQLDKQGKDMAGATEEAAGSHGLVPAPAAGANGKFLRGDGTWQTPQDTTYGNATQNTAGLQSAADKKKLDGIEEGANAYSHPTGSGNKHIPSGGSAGQVLRYSADGTAMWGEDKDTTYSDMSGATATAAGTHGLVPAPAAGANGKFLRGDGTWQTPQDTTYGNATQKTAGLQSAADKKKLDGIEEGANAYSHPTGSGNKHIPSGGSAGQVLRYSADGTAMWGEDKDTTYGVATQNAAGLQSAADKKKLDGIEEGANKYIHPTGSGNKHIPSGGSAGQVLKYSADGTAMWGEDKDTTYGVATQNADGLQSAADKKNLDDLTENALRKTDIVQNATTDSSSKVVSAAVAKNLQDQITEQNTKITNTSAHFTGQNGFYVSSGKCEQLKGRYLLNFTIGGQGTANTADTEFYIGDLDIKPIHASSMAVVLKYNSKVVGNGILTVDTTGKVTLNSPVSYAYLAINGTIALFVTA